MPLRFAIPDYTLKNPYNVTRWMCSKCGLILDYQFNLGPEEPGWPMIKPSLDEQDQLQYIDRNGVGHFPDFEVSLHCPRCWVDLDEIKPIPVQVVDFQIGKLTQYLRQLLAGSRSKNRVNSAQTSNLLENVRQ